MSAMYNIAAFPVAALEGLVRFIGAGQEPCGCTTVGNPSGCSQTPVPQQATVNIVSMPAQAPVVTMPAYVTYKVMQPVAPASAYAPNTYLYAPLPFRQ